MYLGQPDVTGMAQITVAIALREGSFHSSTTSILSLKFRRLLARARLLDGLMLLAWPNADRARAAFGLGTVAATWTDPTVLGGKPNHHHGVPMHILGRVPCPAQFACWTNCLLRLPVETKLGDCDPSWRVGLPSRVADHWPNHAHTMLSLTCHQHTGVDVANVEIMLTRQQILGRQISLDRRGQIAIGGRGGCGSDVCDQVGCVIITGFGQMGLVADPTGVALGFVARLDVIG